MTNKSKESSERKKKAANSEYIVICEKKRMTFPSTGPLPSASD
jgi:hypothetical protein